jgi:hypothetical protein
VGGVNLTKQVSMLKQKTYKYFEPDGYVINLAKFTTRYIII